MFKNLSLLVALVLFSVATTFAQKLPNIHILATGGTIAGTGASSTGTNYTAGQVAIGTLLSAVPEIQKIANVTGEQIVKIGSQDMTDDVWLTLAKTITWVLLSDFRRKKENKCMQKWHPHSSAPNRRN